MELKIVELLLQTPAIYLLFGLITWLLTYVVKLPIKKMTAKLPDEKRKAANKLILFLPIFIGIAHVLVYFKIKNLSYASEDVLQKGFYVGMLAITIYAIFEGLRGKKTEYESDPEGIALYNLLLIYANDKNKVKLLLDQCRDNLDNKGYSIADTVKGFLPVETDAGVVDTIVKSIEKYFKNEKEDPRDAIVR